MNCYITGGGWGRGGSLLSRRKQIKIPTQRHLHFENTVGKKGCTNFQKEKADQNESGIIMALD